MAIVTTDNAHYGAIAAAIREKLGVQTRYTPAQMAPAIRSIAARCPHADVFCLNPLAPMSWTGTAREQEGE